VTERACLLARRLSLQHPRGTLCETPLLVPSFSSKGFPLALPTSGDTIARTRGKKTRTPRPRAQRSTASQHLHAIGPAIQSALLVSAYDLHFKLLDLPRTHFTGHTLLFLDSGGYELAPEYDSTEPKQFTEYRPREGFTEVAYEAVLRRLPRTAPFVITNFDWATRHAPLEQQISAAKALFSRHPQFLSNFLIKPGCNARGQPQSFIDVDRYVRPLLPEMSGFQILGVTEKELGLKLMDRLAALAKLRSAMDAEGLERIPIHLWGGLDPLLTPLYCLAGGSIFDGVSWLRYAYIDGAAIAWDSAAVIRGRTDSSVSLHSASTMGENLGALESLQIDLRRFIDRGNGDFSVFTHHGKELRRAYEAMQASIAVLRPTKRREKK
jgi:hypothetical protein